MGPNLLGKANSMLLTSVVSQSRISQYETESTHAVPTASTVTARRWICQNQKPGKRNFGEKRFTLLHILGDWYLRDLKRMRAEAVGQSNGDGAEEELTADGGRYTVPACWKKGWAAQGALARPQHSISLERIRYGTTLGIRVVAQFVAKRVEGAGFGPAGCTAGWLLVLKLAGFFRGQRGRVK
jgi:hypothetical protein